MLEKPAESSWRHVHQARDLLQGDLLLVVVPDIVEHLGDVRYVLRNRMDWDTRRRYELEIVVLRYRFQYFQKEDHLLERRPPGERDQAFLHERNTSAGNLDTIYREIDQPLNGIRFRDSRKRILDHVLVKEYRNCPRMTGCTVCIRRLVAFENMRQVLPEEVDLIFVERHHIVGNEQIALPFQDKRNLKFFMKMNWIEKVIQIPGLNSYRLFI